MEAGMKEYRIKITDRENIDWSKVEKAEINECVWLFDYQPVCFAQAVFIKDEGFLIRMECFEKDPKAVQKGFYSDVYKDSCLEMFAKFDRDSEKYVNIEMNSIASSLIAIGEGRHGRVKITEFISRPFPVKAEKNEESWAVTVFVSLTDLEKIYGVKKEKFIAGYEFYGNFYKCGDETETEHYLMWNRVETEKPDYHRPEFFGKFILTE